MSRLPFDPTRARGGGPPDSPAERGGGGAGRRAPLTVSELAGLIKTAVAAGVPAKVRVVGEVSNFSRRTHWFFSIKDAGCAMRCVCFASAARRVGFDPADGQQVVLTGRVDFYDAQGQVQLYVDRIEPVGVGALELRLRRLIDELRAQGYFDPERKRPLPAIPTRVAVVTSRAAAALQDVVHTAAKRWGGCQLLLVDVPVQGQGAAERIAAAIDRLSDQGPRLGIDAVIMTRGGGSIEDLWAFNERVVAEALWRCRLPVVAAIGHETDTTVAELVADVRCATPTQAAMTVVPDRAAVAHQVEQYAGRLTAAVRRTLDAGARRLEAAARHALWRRPGLLVDRARQEVDRLARRLMLGLPRMTGPKRDRLATATGRLAAAMAARLAPAPAQLDAAERRLARAADTRLRQAQRHTEALARQLDAVAPNRVLERGYSYTLGPDGRVLRRADQAPPGTRITSVLAAGRLTSRVEGDPGGGSDPTPRPPQPPASSPGAQPRRSARRRSREADQPGLF